MSGTVDRLQGLKCPFVGHIWEVTQTKLAGSDHPELNIRDGDMGLVLKCARCGKAEFAIIRKEKKNVQADE